MADLGYPWTDDMSAAIVDSIERALADLRNDNKLDEVRQLSKPTDRDPEMEHSMPTDKAIRRAHGKFSTIWLHTTETLIALYYDVESQVREGCDQVDRLVQSHAVTHFNHFNTIDRQYLNTSGFGVFEAKTIPLRLPSTAFATPSTNPAVGLLSLPPELLTEIFSLLCPTSGYGRGALALTCKYLASLSSNVPPVYRTNSLDKTGATISLTGSRTHRYCLGCDHMRPIDPKHWQTHFTTIRNVWLQYCHPNPLLPLSEPQKARLLKSDQTAFNKLVRTWRHGRPHIHPLQDDEKKCFTRNLHAWEDEQTPLCPICAAQHVWENRYMDRSREAGISKTFGV